MSKPGPPKTPTVLALVRGNPGRRPLPKNEPKPPPLLNFDPPEYLADEAKTEWRRVCPILAKLGLMTRLDVAVLAGYCGAHADLIDATEKQRGKTTVLKTHNGNWIQSPFVSMIRQARIDMVRFGAQLGMTPSARAGMDIQIGNPDAQTPADKDPAASYF